MCTNVCGFGRQKRPFTTSSSFGCKPHISSGFANLAVGGQVEAQSWSLIPWLSIRGDEGSHVDLFKCSDPGVPCARLSFYQRFVRFCYKYEQPEEEISPRANQPILIIAVERPPHINCPSIQRRSKKQARPGKGTLPIHA